MLGLPYLGMSYSHYVKFNKTRSEKENALCHKFRTGRRFVGNQEKTFFLNKTNKLCLSNRVGIRFTISESFTVIIRWKGEVFTS